MKSKAHLLLTSEMLTTSMTVKKALLSERSLKDQDNIRLIQRIRDRLTALATKQRKEYTTVLMHGSRFNQIESVLGSLMPRTDGKLLILSNGKNGHQMIHAAAALDLTHETLIFNQIETLDHSVVEEKLLADPGVTHVAMVHCETAAGILNPIEELCRLAKRFNIQTIVDATSSFGGLSLDVDKWQIDCLISSSGNCLQGIPGIAFVIAKNRFFENCEGNARSFSLDLHAQYSKQALFQSGCLNLPGPIVLAFDQALKELQLEGGIEKRALRYQNNQERLVIKMKQLGFDPLLNWNQLSPILTAFVYPDEHFSFKTFDEQLKKRGFVISPGALSGYSTFRISTIGDIYAEHIDVFLKAVEEILQENQTDTVR